MSPAEQNPNASQAKADQSIETIYTTVESQHDRTDWLTVVSNLRQINRQLLEEIARLEQALASAKQSLHTQKEANQNHEITILQQQDELKAAQDRVGALFQQLETSHQIGQRQQTLIETLSHQLEIAQTIIPQLETENDELSQKYQQQSQKLTKTEQVALELHRRFKLLQSPANETSSPKAIPNPAESESDRSAEILSDTEIDLATENLPHPDSSLETAISEANISISTSEIEPAPPLTPIQIPQTEILDWTPSAPKLPTKTILSPPPSSSTTNWREAIASSNNRHSSTLDLATDFTIRSSETVDKESNVIDKLISTTSTPNWPAPTVNRDDQADESAAKTVKIDLPKFPKRSDN